MPEAFPCRSHIVRKGVRKVIVSEVKWRDFKLGEETNKWKMGREMKMSGGMCVLSLICSYAVCMWVTVQYVIWLLFAVCLFVFATFSLFVLCLFSCFVCFSFYFCVFCVFVLFLLMYIVVPFLCTSSLTTATWWEQLQFINIVSYHIYHI